MLTAGTLVVSLRILHGKKAHCLTTKQGLYRPLNVADFKVGNTDFNISRMVDRFNFPFRFLLVLAMLIPVTMLESSMHR